MVANRGEIAIRIFKTAKRKGWSTVAVYSDADKDSLHLAFADEAYCIGPGPSRESYLNINSILTIARSCGVDCIHPGYGFLSENPDFVSAVKAAGILFVGPNIEAMNLLGNKISAKKMASSLGIPLVPGNHHAISDMDEAIRLANDIGFPIMIKAAAGGGGKGMRVVHAIEDLKESIQLAQTEAKSSFGNDEIFMEQFILSPRHIEVQVIGDQQGHLVYLPERECSLQRRHQKIMEESPANNFSTTLRRKMGEDAVRLAKASGYFSTGTVEFIVDQQDNYFFLEMNTRLQVEHTVTEMITNLDLVDMQLDIVYGLPLQLQQDDITYTGHAIQWRVYAEDPNQNFAPSTGQITNYQEPNLDHIRIDSGYNAQKRVPIYYDPMIAKLIAWGPNRQDSLAKLRLALRKYDIDGIYTTIAFGIKILDQPAIQNGEYAVDFLHLHLEKILQDSSSLKYAQAAASLALYLHRKSLNSLKPPNQ